MKRVVRKLFFAWNEEKEKLFLEEMALKGYRLVKVQLGKYTFVEDKPKRLIYQFDFRSLNKMSEEEYLQIYEDAGWNFVFRFGGWYYFSREGNEEKIDLSIFSNNESKRAKYRRLILFLFLTGFPLYYQILIFYPNMAATKLEFPKFYFFFRIIVLIFTGLHMYAVVKIVNMYRKLKRDIKE